MDNPLIPYLKSFLSTERLERMEQVLSRRTEYLTVVLEDLHYSQNASSIVRHCDAFGIQQLHVIENRNRFKLKNHAVRGTLKWIELNHFDEGKSNSLQAIGTLKDRGYRIVATSPRDGGRTPTDFDLTAGPAAFFFGNERDGLSDEILDNADEFLNIPMEGFVESLNISASCAIILQLLGDRLRHSELDWQLSKDRKEEIFIEWLKGSIKKIDQVMIDFENRSI